MENLLVDIDFEQGAFPTYAGNGNGSSPGIRIGRIQAKYLAIIFEDVIGTADIFTYWLIWNIVARDSIPEHIPPEPVLEDPFPAVQGTNDAGTIGYERPCPAAPEGHTFYVNVYGLDARLDIPPGSDRKTLITAMKGHLVQYGSGKIPAYSHNGTMKKMPDHGSPC